MHAQFDAIVVVVEPTPESVTVARRYRELAAAAGVADLVAFVGNKDGSPNTSGIVSLTAALDWLDDAGVDSILRWNTALATRLTAALSAMPHFEVLGCQRSAGAQRHGIVAFRHETVGSNDLGFILAAEGLMVRADGHCQGGEGEKTASVRVSLHAYNSPGEVDRLISVLAGLR